MTDTSDPKNPTGGITSSSTAGPTNPGKTGGPASSTESTGSSGTTPRSSSAFGGTDQSTGSFGGAGQSTGQSAGSFGESGAGTGSEKLSDTARSAMGDAAQAARGMAAEQTDRAKSAVAEEVSSVAQALRTAADELREGSAQERTFAQIADTLADTADAIRGKDLAEMVQEATQMARRHPMTFLGAAALIGFTAVRFAKASRDDTWRRRGSDRSAAYRSTGARHGVSTHPVDPSASTASMGSTL